MHPLLIVHSQQNKTITENQFTVRGLSAFSAEHAKMLESWLSLGVNTTRAALGIYPSPLNLYVYPRKSNQPVPWAYTRRDGKGSVHFHVDTRFGLQKFVDDWTVYHELAHMALPYLGSQYRWFSEGFASFMQYQIMAQAGVLKGNLHERYSNKINPQLRWFNSDLTAASIATRLMDNKQYPAAYWGSAYFFVLADSKLQKQRNISLTQLISHYQDCCRANDHNLEDVLTSLDGMIEGKLFSQLMNDFKNLPARSLYPEVFGQ